MNARQMGAYMAKMLVNENYQLVQVKNGVTIVHGASDSNNVDSEGASTAISDLIAFYYNYRKQFGAMTIIGAKTRNTYATLGSK